MILALTIDILKFVLLVILTKVCFDINRNFKLIEAIFALPQSERKW